MFKVYKIKTKEAIYKAHICLVLTQACLIHIVTVIKNQKYFKNLYKNYLNENFRFHLELRFIECEEYI